MTSETQAGADSIIYIDENQWRDIRKENFAQLIRLLKMLPKDKPQITEDTVLEKDKVLNTANTLNRDLLEKAINYFKYDFNSMAYMAAFLAVFFDLGSLLSGCLSYAMKSYKKTQQSGKNN